MIFLIYCYAFLRNFDFVAPRYMEKNIGRIFQELSKFCPGIVFFFGNYYSRYFFLIFLQGLRRKFNQVLLVKLPHELLHAFFQKIFQEFVRKLSSGITLEIPPGIPLEISWKNLFENLALLALETPTRFFFSVNPLHFSRSSQVRVSFSYDSTRNFAQELFPDFSKKIFQWCI